MESSGQLKPAEEKSKRERIRYFRFCNTEGGSKEKCSTLLQNGMQCKKQVTKFVIFVPPSELSLSEKRQPLNTEQIGFSPKHSANYCEAHFQIKFAEAQRDGARIENVNEEHEI